MQSDTPRRCLGARLKPDVSFLSKLMSNDKTYDVGYRRPPPASRFKPGQSGNPKGRQRGAKNFATELADELQEKIRCAMAAAN